MFFLTARDSCRCAAWFAAAALSWNACHAQSGTQTKTYSIDSNLRLRISRNDLGNIVPARQQSRRAVRIAQGGDQLLNDCLEHPENWYRDSWIGRLAHREPFSTIGGRERSSPGLHVVFYRGMDGKRATWAHFDLHGPGSMVPHLSEVVRNRLTFGRTSEYEVFRGLVRLDPNALVKAPKPGYDFTAHAKRYLWSTFGPQPLGAAVASGIASAAFVSVSGLSPANGGYANRIAANLATNTIAKSLEFGTAAFLQQDEGFSPSGEDGFRRRATYALYRIFVVPGRDGDELAFPRLASAVGTAWITNRWHPWQEAEPNMWSQAALILTRYAFKSYWTEFKPEILRETRKVLRRKDPGLQVVTPAPPPADAVRVP
ncbi:MAG TPA: hypothetical protein VKU01_08370 [Bryobacteraceae bacterium]|nr:hypothetical protein [Bryobacteraceae bacterium]